MTTLKQIALSLVFTAAGSLAHAESPTPIEIKYFSEQKNVKCTLHKTVEHFDDFGAKQEITTFKYFIQGEKAGDKYGVEVDNEEVTFRYGTAPWLITMDLRMKSDLGELRTYFDIPTASFIKAVDDYRASRDMIIKYCKAYSIPDFMCGSKVGEIVVQHNEDSKKQKEGDRTHIAGVCFYNDL